MESFERGRGDVQEAIDCTCTPQARLARPTTAEMPNKFVARFVVGLCG
jgi:hypothetical protein